MEYNLPLSLDDIRNLLVALSDRIEKCKKMNANEKNLGLDTDTYWQDDENAARELRQRLVDLVE